MTEQQAALPLAWPQRYGLDNFVAAACNAQALTYIKDIALWKTPVLIIQGPSDSGKSHLASIFSSLHNAIPIKTINDIDQVITMDAPITMIDDVDTFLNDGESATSLFHLINHITHKKGRLLLTGKIPPATWVAQPDLLSRLQASQSVTLEHPSEDMIKAAYQKMFLDRGLLVDNKVLDYLAMRSERSFSGIRANIDRLDVLALEKGRKVTIPLVTESHIFDAP